MPDRANRFSANISSLFITLGLIAVVLFGAYLRLAGLKWGEYQYLHPDERFLVWVGTDISPVENLSDYWDTVNSSLNPHNRGHGFYVYGTLPMFLARYAVEWIYGHSGFNEMTDIGRALSALFDLGTVLLVFLTGSVVYKRRVGLLAAAFSALAVLQIQYAHFFTMDSFTTFFAVLTMYFAARVAYEREESDRDVTETPNDETAVTDLGLQPDSIPVQGSGIGITTAPVSQGKAGLADTQMSYIRQPLFALSLGFGIALGMAVASKINAAPLALLLPLAIFLRFVDREGEARDRAFQQALIYLVFAGAVSLLVFRIFQPYAFSGPGFFGLKPNPAWVANLNELRNQASGDVDFPPALQWARRPVWFAWQNMVLWGMGLPLGLLAWAGFLWAGWRMLVGEWRRHILLWSWTALYFIWQSLVFNPSMRYQLLVYPMLFIFAAWAVFALWEKASSERDPSGDLGHNRWSSGWRILAVLVGLGILGATAVYAFAFTGIYLRPITRVAASRWIYQHIPGPINLQINQAGSVYNQLVPFPYNYLIQPEIPYYGSFTASASGELDEVVLGEIVDPAQNYGEKRFTLLVSELPGGGNQVGSATQQTELNLESAQSGQKLAFVIDPPALLEQGQEYFLELHLAPGQGPVNLTGSLDMMIQSEDGVTQSFVLENALVDYGTPFTASFIAPKDGFITGAELNLSAVQTPEEDEALRLTLSADPEGEDQLASASIVGNITEKDPANINGTALQLDQPVPLTKGQNYYLMIAYEGPREGVTLKGAAVANEGAWDDGLPVRVDGYDGFGGIYQPGLNFDMYEDDNPNKLARFLSILDQAEYLLISSNRQWGSLPRLPERFPMTAEYYRRLLGCPAERSISWCYNVAKPGDFQGDLGYELVKVFQSDPQLGPFRINDQFAEEAFTVYDHPKVFIFEKQDSYNPQNVRDILGAVDLSKVIHITPKKAGSLPRDMMLPPDRLAEQRAAGTWSELFNTQSLLNRWPWLGLGAWYLAMLLLGWVAYPLVRYALPGLEDGGYPLARTAGLLLLSYLVWLASSLGGSFNRLTISLALAVILIVALLLGWRQRESLRMEWRDRRNYFLLIEALFLAFFIFDLLIRLGNPDLWHPWKGGEKPMDFSYFNAVLKSDSFPPYDPWFAGGYINYYYYGFVLVGVLVKWLGIVPSVAYNLIIPTIFSLIALGAFSIAWNLVARNGSETTRAAGSNQRLWGFVRSLPFSAGIGGALGMAVLGNLGIVRMIYQGYQRLAAPGGNIEGAFLIERLIWAVKGALMTLIGAQLPYGLADWYWNPSRVIPAPNEVEPITEFPFFTVLYGDPHAHLFAMPIALLALAFAASVILSRAWKRPGVERTSRSILQVGASLLLGGLAIGALRPTNTWDFPTYLAIGLVAVGYAVWKNCEPVTGRPGWLAHISPRLQRVGMTLACMAMLGVLSFLLFQPYAKWYVQGYTHVDPWKGTHTPIWSYLTHWGLFLFVIVSWMVWETRDWMASTPLSQVRKLEPFRALIGAGVIVLLAWVAILLFMKVSIAWLVLPLAAWSGVLLFRPGLPDSKRIVLFLVGTGLVLTLVVEVIVLRGDIARMNTVFKFYLQVWTLFSISAAASFGWLLLAWKDWIPSWRLAWQVAVTLLVASAALYPLLGGTAKIKDRMAPQAPHTLDGMTFMEYATYDDLGRVMDLSQDYRAIRWLQENVQDSPVIVEGNMVEYHWGTRNTIYTGLPNVVGWNWHQRQQRAITVENLIENRIAEVNEFYLSTDPLQAKAFLDKYGVKYIIVGQLEHALYPGPGLDKFEQLDDDLWHEVYRDGETVIYEVNG
jgi:YYY domain-containing protein